MKHYAVKDATLVANVQYKVKRYPWILRWVQKLCLWLAFKGRITRTIRLSTSVSAITQQNIWRDAVRATPTPPDRA